MEAREQREDKERGTTASERALSVEDFSPGFLCETIWIHTSYKMVCAI